jgi:hypothetical protein
MLVRGFVRVAECLNRFLRVGAQIRHGKLSAQFHLRWILASARAPKSLRLRTSAQFMLTRHERAVATTVVAALQKTSRVVIRLA